ncbi:MAG: ABC transporter permease [Candidatus Stygibacter australis]|nr:ABC transporter permease [Candidatus Stygibacter australis]
MFWNYLKIAVRNLMRKKFYTIINIAGLAIGICCAIMIGLYVQNELSYDKYNEDYERIYRLESHFTINETDDLFAVTAIPLAPAIKLEFPEDVEQYCRYRAMDNNLFQIDNKKYFEDNVHYADSTVFEIFSYEFLRGEPSEALDDPNEIVLTESFARRIFGTQDPLGEYLETGYGFGFTVTGVIKDLPQNSHLNFEALASMVTLAQFYGAETFHSLDPNLFWNVGFYSFIKLTEGGSIDNIMRGYPAFNEKYIKALGETLNAKFQLMAQRLDKVHLNSKLKYELPTGNMGYVFIFGIVALFLLLIGCINYMNMATAQSSGRATEVGIRKVAGAQRGSLQMQFLLESVVISIFAYVLAVLAVELLLPTFNELAGRELSLNIGENLNYYGLFLLVSVVVGLVSGSYPAFYLSSFVPVEVLKGKLSKGSTTLRKLLVVVQFSISIIMIICTLGVVSQLKFMQNTDLGFDKDNIVVLTIRDTTGARNLATFRDELLQHPKILKAGTSSSIPGSGYGIIVQRFETDEGEMSEKAINFVMVDENYLDVMDIKILLGREFDPELATDLEEACLINQSCAENLGWGENAIGKKLDFGAAPDGTATRNTRVIGVVKDFHYTSLHNLIDPLILMLSDEPLQTITLRIDQSDLESTLSFMEEKWNEFCPTFPFSYEFMDDNLRAQYEAEEKTSRVFSYFTIICIFIACLGLLGLTAYATEQRIREISIRKVLGATEKSIVYLLTSNFAILVIISNVIAWPVAWWGMKNWLENFAYSTKLSPLIYVAAGLIALIIAILTISIRAIHAARTNPADALKYE